MDAKGVREFVERVKPELDEPGTYVPMINQYLTKEDDWGEGKTRICYALPVPEAGSVQNLGIAILSQIANEQMGPDYLASVSYFPETKMLRRMKKYEVPMFDNWLFHPWKDFDVVGISSFYSIQYLNFIPMLKQAGIPYKAEDRLDSWNDPIVALGGIQAYSASTMEPCFDLFFIGEGEVMNTEFLQLLRKRKAEGVSKREFLLEAARDIQGIYLPWCYNVDYYPADDEKHPNQIKSISLTEVGKQAGVPQIVLKACVEFKNTPPLTKTFVSNNAGGSMSIKSIVTACRH